MSFLGREVWFLCAFFFSPNQFPRELKWFTPCLISPPIKKMWPDPLTFVKAKSSLLNCRGYNKVNIWSRFSKVVKFVFPVINETGYTSTIGVSNVTTANWIKAQEIEKSVDPKDLSTQIRVKIFKILNVHILFQPELKMNEFLVPVDTGCVKIHN